MKKKTKIIVGAVGGLSAAVIGFFGVTLYNQAKEIASQPALYGVQPASVLTYNKGFEQYFGENKVASKVRELINLVDRKNQTDGYYSQISLVGIDSVDKVDFKKKYNVLAEEYDENGAVSQIRIEEVEE